MKLEINGVIFETDIEENDTASAFLNILPQSLNMRDLNKNEKYCFLNKSLPIKPTKPKIIHTGDIMLWKDNCIVIFYKTFQTNYLYTKIAKIKNISYLEKSLGDGYVTAKFTK